MVGARVASAYLRMPYITLVKRVEAGKGPAHSRLNKGRGVFVFLVEDLNRYAEERGITVDRDALNN